MKKIIFSIISAISALGLWSCSNGDEPSAIPADVCYDFVTFESMSSGNARFTLQKSGDSPVIEYYTNAQYADTIFKAGRRMIIQYKRADNAMPYTSGLINLYGYRGLDNTCQNPVVGTESASPSDLVDMVMITRTGPYINMQLNLYCQKAVRPKVLLLQYEAAQAGEACPELRLVYNQTQPGENHFTGYASFDVSALWSKPSCEGIKISYATPDGEQSTTFMKN